MDTEKIALRMTAPPVKQARKRCERECMVSSSDWLAGLFSCFSYRWLRTAGSILARKICRDARRNYSKKVYLKRFQITITKVYIKVYICDCSVLCVHKAYYSKSIVHPDNNCLSVERKPVSLLCRNFFLAAAP